jgi:lipase
LAARAEHRPAQAHHRVAQEVAEHLAQDADRRWRWRWRYAPAMAVTAHSEMAQRLTPRPATPTLVVRATEDGMPAEQVECWRLATRDALTVEEFHCGHQVYLERPAETAELIRRFTRSDLPRS